MAEKGAEQEEAVHEDPSVAPEFPRPKLDIKKRPCRLGFGFPPSLEELEAMHTVSKMRAVGEVLSVDKSGDRIVLTVEWIGDQLPPAVLGHKEMPARMPRYHRLGTKPGTP